MSDLRNLTTWLNDLKESTVEQAVDAMQETVAEGAEAQRQILRDAHTRTGLARQALGAGQPGREETGNMIDSIDESVATETEFGGDVTTVIGQFGWSDPEEYFLEQDGLIEAEKIPAANSLITSGMMAESILARAIKERGLR